MIDCGLDYITDTGAVCLGWAKVPAKIGLPLSSDAEVGFSTKRAPLHPGGFTACRDWWHGQGIVAVVDRCAAGGIRVTLQRKRRHVAPVRVSAHGPLA